MDRKQYTYIEVRISASESMVTVKRVDVQGWSDEDVNRLIAALEQQHPSVKYNICLVTSSRELRQLSRSK